jgi:putative hydrolase of the HAD superfamily
VVLLDLGKVLVDFDFSTFGARLAREAGVEAEAVRAAFSGGDLPVRYESGLVSDADFHAEVCRRLGYDVAYEEFVGAWNGIFHPEPIMPDDLIAALASRAPLWIVSNTNRLHFDFIVERYPLLRHFSGYVLSHEVQALKPDPRIFRAALARAVSTPEETLFVDDQAANIAAARELGLDAFRFEGVEHFERELGVRGLL